MNYNKNNIYSLANKIRTKLLLFIDNEISRKSLNSHKKNIINEEQIEIHFEETYNQKSDNKICYSINFSKTPPTLDTSSKIKKTVNNQNYFNSNSNTRRDFQRRTMEHKIDNCNPIRIASKNKTTNNITKNNNFILVDDNKYMIKANIKQSRAILIEKKKLVKSEKDETYLKNLCRSFKKECSKIKITVNGCDYTNPINNNSNFKIRNFSLKTKKAFNIKDSNRSQNKRNSSKVIDCSDFIIPLVFPSRSRLKRLKTTKKNFRQTPIKTSSKNKTYKKN